MLIELILTIAAWRKGWDPVALIPMAVGFTIGVICSGMANSLVPAVMAHPLIYAALITMIIAGRSSAGYCNLGSRNATPGIDLLRISWRGSQPPSPQRIVPIENRCSN